MKTILQAVKEKLSSSGATIAGGLGGEHKTVSEAIDGLDLGGGITPTGKLTIDANTGGLTVDVAQYEFVEAAVVDAYVLTCDPNNSTDDDSYIAVVKGSVIQLPDGTGLTAPSGKEFGGWALDASGQDAIDGGTISINQDTTIYAVWVDAQSS